MSDEVSDIEYAAVARILTAGARVMHHELQEVSEGDRVMLIVTTAPGRGTKVQMVGDFASNEELRSFLEFLLANCKAAQDAPNTIL